MTWSCVLQRTHWKQHKRVCGVLIDDGTLCLRFDAVACFRKGSTTINYNKGAVIEVSAPKNIHCSSRFIVKIQPPAGAELCSEWMCYDEARSFEAWIPHTTQHIKHALEMLQKEGIKCRPAPGPATLKPSSIIALKGYFYAQWEGQHVCVFLDKLASPQNW